MKEVIKLVIAVLAALIGAALPIIASYNFWDWSMAQVPPGEWAGMMKLGVTLLLLVMGGGFTVFVTVGATMVGMAFGLFVGELIAPDKRLR